MIVFTMNENIIFVFPGQGVQNIGMGAEVWRDFSAARFVFEQVSDITKKDIVKILFKGPEVDLNLPENASVAIFTCSVAVARVIEDEFNKSLYDIAYAYAGHSMGQYSALCCADSLSMEDALYLLKKRSYYMYNNSVNDAGMIVVVGISKDKLDSEIDDLKKVGFAQSSNINADNQFVVSGYNNVLDKLTSVLRKHGVKLVRRMKVAYPAHCLLMKDAENEMRKDIKNIKINTPKTKWFSNHVADIVSAPEQIRDLLCSQFTHGVRWADIVKKFPEHNITKAFELGAGRTLTGLINRANVNCVAKKTDKSSDLKSALNDINNFIAKTR